jgi:hypothetical protein
MEDGWHDGRAGFPACRFTGFSNPVFQQATGKSPEPADKNVCPTRCFWKSGGGPPHSKTLARGPMAHVNAQRFGVFQSSGALAAGSCIGQDSF